MSWNFRQFSVNVFKGPHLGDVKNKNDSVSSLVNVNEFCIEHRLEHFIAIGCHGGSELQTVQLLPLLALVHYVPDLNLDDVVGGLVVPLNGSNLDLVGGDVFLGEFAALKI